MEKYHIEIEIEKWSTLKLKLQKKKSSLNFKKKIVIYIAFTSVKSIEPY